MYFFIVNPASKTGKGLKIWKECIQLLKAKNIEYKAYKTTPEKNACYYMLGLLKKYPDKEIRVYILGGDGTINEALQGMHEEDFERVKIGYIPTGSSNDLARSLNYEKDYRETFERVILSNAYKEIDVGKIEYNHTEVPGYLKRFFVVSAGMGFDAAVCEEAMHSKLKKVLNDIKLGKLSYLAICLKQLMTIPRFSVDIIKGEDVIEHRDNCYFVCAMNHMYQGGGIKFCPDAVNSDGLVDICYASDISRLEVVTTLPLAFSGKHIGKKGIGNFTTDKIRIKADQPVWVHTDGEVKTKSSDVTITCMHRKLKFIV